MISTITPIMTAAQSSSVPLVLALVLLALLFQKELTASSENIQLKKWGQCLDLAILPLLVAFGLIIIFKLIEVLN